MVSGVLSFLFGVLLLQQFSSLPDVYWAWALLLVFASPFLPNPYKNIFFLMAGFLWALLRAYWVLEVALPAELQGKDLLATGVIASIPLENNRKQRFEFNVEHLMYGDKKIQFVGKIRLSLYHSRHAYKSKIKLKAGQRWQFWLRLKQPHGFMNPGVFDYEGWLYQKTIRATGYVRLNDKKHQFAKKISDEANGYHFTAFRQHLYDKLKVLTVNSNYAGILIALAMGERAGITQQQWQVFRATGTSHLVAISGLHIGLLAGFVFFIVRRLWPYFGAASLIVASPRAAALIALLIAAFYAALSGFAVPAQRALIMLSIVMLSVFKLHKVQSSQVLSFALLMVLLFDPASVLSAGFWLSFAAITIIALAAFARLNVDNNWQIWGRLQWRISLVLIPLLMFLFQQASLISPLTNLFAIPVVSFLVVPLVLFATSLASFFVELPLFLFSLADYIVTGLWWSLSFLADTSVSQWQSVKPSIVSLCLASLGIVLLLSPKGWPAKYMGFFLLVPLVWPNTPVPENNEAEITLLDVGQGLAVVVQTQKHALVFDTGPKFSARFDTGAAVIIPFLRHKNINRLDKLILSHEDNDHRGGFSSLKKEITISEVLSSYGEKGSYPCRAGDNWRWEGVFFEILNPERGHRFKKRNNASCVLRISAGKESVLLSADIEKKAEKQLLQRYSDSLHSTYLIAPHHGSKTSSSSAFLKAVNPEYILIPVGYRNRYRMPHSSVLARYHTQSIKFLSTDSSGAISIKLGQKNSSFSPYEYRKNHRKYWNSHH